MAELIGALITLIVGVVLFVAGIALAALMIAIPGSIIGLLLWAIVGYFYPGIPWLVYLAAGVLLYLLCARASSS